MIVEAGEDLGRDGGADIPRDKSGSGRAGVRLPLPEEENLGEDFVVVEAGDVEDESLAVGDIPRDFSGEGRAGFRLPLPEKDDDVVVVEAGGLQDAGRSLVDKNAC